MKPTRILPALLVTLLATGCATARVVNVQPRKGGVIAVLPAQSPEAREKATALMSENCGSGGFEITEEGEAVIGATRYSNTQASGITFGGPSYSGTSDETQKTEWRITYKCKTK